MTFKQHKKSTELTHTHTQATLLGTCWHQSYGRSAMDKIMLQLMFTSYIRMEGGRKKKRKGKILWLGWCSNFRKCWTVCSVCRKVRRKKLLCSSLWEELPCWWPQSPLFITVGSRKSQHAQKAEHDPVGRYSGHRVTKDWQTTKKKTSACLSTWKLLMKHD